MEWHYYQWRYSGQGHPPSPAPTSTPAPVSVDMPKFVVDLNGDLSPATLLQDEARTVELRGRRVQVVGVDPRSYRLGKSNPARPPGYPIGPTFSEPFESPVPCGSPRPIPTSG